MQMAKLSRVKRETIWVGDLYGGSVLKLDITII